MTQKEFEIPEQKKTRNYYKEHICTKYKKERKSLVFMRESIDPKYFIGECRQCKENIIEMAENV
jgi:hypothetical protein